MATQIAQVPNSLRRLLTSAYQAGAAIVTADALFGIWVNVNDSARHLATDQKITEQDLSEWAYALTGEHPSDISLARVPFSIDGLRLYAVIERKYRNLHFGIQFVQALEAQQFQPQRELVSAA